MGHPAGAKEDAGPGERRRAAHGGRAGEEVGGGAGEEKEEEEEEQEQQGEQPPAANEAGPLEAPAPAEVGPMGPSMPLGKEAKEERREVPARRSAWGKERIVQAMPPRETDKEMAQRLQAQEEEEEARRGQDAATLVVVREAAGPMTQGQVEGLGAPS